MMFGKYEIDINKYIVMAIGGGLVFWILTMSLNWIQSLINGFVGILIIGILIFVGYIVIKEIHPGKEEFLEDIVPVLIMGSILMTITSQIGIQQLVPVISSSIADFGMQFGLVVTSVFIADTIYLKFKERRRYRR